MKKKVSHIKLTDNVVLSGGPRPFCKECGWCKGGPDSWDGQQCKCGHTEPPIVFVTDGPPEPEGE